MHGCGVAKRRLTNRLRANEIKVIGNLRREWQLPAPIHGGELTARWQLALSAGTASLYVLQNKQDWVAWTPEGFYGATPGAFGVLQWQVNRGFDAAADTVPVDAIPKLRRPDALKLVLQELETARALGIAEMKAARRNVQIATRSAKAPGARLHVLTIGVSDYGDKASDLRLKFAHRDAQDVASALVNTQGGGLYAEVKPNFYTTARRKRRNFRSARRNGAQHGEWRGPGPGGGHVLWSRNHDR